MLVFSFNLGGTGGAGGARAAFHPLMLLLPLLLDLNLLQQVIGFLFGWSLSPEQRTQRQRLQNTSATQQQYAGFSKFLHDAFWSATATFICYLFFRLAVWVSDRGGFLRIMRSISRGQVPQRVYSTRRHNQQQRHRHRLTVEQVAAALQKMPTERHATDDELQSMSIHELKERLAARNVDCANFIEKHEFLDQLRGACGGGSSATSCSICCDDYEAGDPVRLLPCHHRFHIDCIDKWLLTATDYTRPPSCPLCNANVIPQTAATR